MKEYWYWIELIGFDKSLPDFGVSDFFSAVGNRVNGISLLFSSVDFVNCHTDLSQERELTRGDCSYGGHEYNEERAIQKWTNFELRSLVKKLHSYNVKVVFSFFNFFMFSDEQGKQSCESFCKENNVICEKLYNGEYRACVSPIKRFSDGSYYEDFIVSKVKKILDDYEFDGVVYADGISSQRHPIQMADYSDDLVEQFVARKSIALPSDICKSCDSDIKKYKLRYKYIYENLQDEWIDFVSSRYAEFIKKQLDLLDSGGKMFIFNSAWTRDPFEARVRYGLDYSKIYDERIYAIMVEDCGSIQPLMSDFDQGGFSIPFKDRRYDNYEFLQTQMALKTLMPNIKHISMCPLKDNAEQWNIVDDMATDFKKAVHRRSLATYFSGGEFLPTSGGAMYCLSDGIKKATWEKVYHNEDTADLPKYVAEGFVAVSHNNFSVDVSNFIKHRTYGQTKILNELLCSSFPICAMTTADSLDIINSPLVFCNLECYNNDVIKKLETYTKNAFIVFDYSLKLARKPSYTISYNKNGLKCFAYNCVSAKDVNLQIDTPQKKLNYYHANNGIWTSKLQYLAVPTRFFKKVTAIARQMINFPSQIANCEVKLFVYKISDKKVYVNVSNDEYHMSSTEIVFDKNVKSCKMIGKPFWYEIVVNKATICPKIPSRSSELLEIEFE